MEIRIDIFWIVLGASLVTFIPRVLPLIVFSRKEIPEWGMRWLSYVPVSVMAALIAQQLFVPDEAFSWDNFFELAAAVPTFLIAVWSRSLLLTVITGVLTMMILRLIA